MLRQKDVANGNLERIVLVCLQTLLVQGKVKPVSAQLQGLRQCCSPIHKHTLHKRKKTGNRLFLFPRTRRAVPLPSSDRICSEVDKQLHRTMPQRVAFERKFTVS